MAMEVVHARCCGVDVHKRTVVACVRSPEGQQTRTYGTTTGELLELADWLLACGVTHVAMESTGVFWQPIYNLLEGTGLTLLVVNAQHVKAVPGRKTDVKDAAWLADLLRHGLVRGSVIPDRPGRELRELVRYRTALVRQRAQVVHRIQKVLEGANVKLASVVSDVAGASGRAMLEALVAGETDPEALAGLARGTLRRKRGPLATALRGQVGPHQRLLLASQLRHLDFLDAELAGLSREIAARLQPVEAVVARLETIPGVGRRTAAALVAELGTDVGRFPTAAHLAAWARVCPGNNESGGKRRPGHIGAGHSWLRGTLVEAAWAAARTKDTYLAAQYRRLAARRGAKRALIALAHTLLVIIYHLLRDGTEYRELGANYHDERHREATVRRAVRRLQRLGYTVTVATA
jgi:transposase